MAENTSTNFKLLVKLLGMTTSANENEATIAMRRANDVASKFGGWEKLLLDRVTIIEDPFEKIERPDANTGRNSHGSTPSAPTRPQDFSFSGFATQPQQPASPATPTPPPGYKPWNSPPPPPPPKPKQHSRYSVNLAVRTNKYSGNCFCCGVFVDGGKGGIFKPRDHNTAATDDWKITCNQCSRIGSSTVPARPAKKRRASTSDILNGL